MSISLYRKYRPQTFSDLVSQDHVRKTLQGALRGGRLSHAYLFSGPRATGKTSTARILAKSVNCPSVKAGQPCNKCQICQDITEGKSLDVLEIDAASSRGIDEIRELREKIKFSPTHLKYKVFIIDEVHMLTREAFNALLKTLEEPPSHAIFILVTTEIHKLPSTIISRCQRFDFRRIKLEDLKKRLGYIASQEKIDISPESLELIAFNASGGLRDAISLLDQASSYFEPGEKQGSPRRGGFYGKKITPEVLKSLLGLTDREALTNLIDFLARRDLSSSLKLTNHLSEEGYDLGQFCKNLISYLRNLLIIKISQEESLIEATEEELKKIKDQAVKFTLEEIFSLIRLFLQAEKEMKTTISGQFPLELAIISANLKKSEKETKKPKGIEKEEEKKSSPEENKENNSPKKTNKDKELKELLKAWDKILENLKEHNHSVRAFLKASRPVKVEDGLITLEFNYRFHKERISDKKNLLLVEKVIREVCGKPYKVKCILSSGKTETSSEDLKDPILKEALKIFGGELIEE